MELARLGRVNHRRPASVRLALPSEAEQIVAVQRDWLAVQPEISRVLEHLDEQEMVSAWQQAIVAPPLATYRVLVALDEQGAVQGFAAIGPSEDPDAEPTDGTVAEFCATPTKERDGHRDRLLHAIADTLRLDGFERATWWVRSTDDLTRQWLVETGWGPDGAHQEIGDEQVRFKQIRMHTSLI